MSNRRAKPVVLHILTRNHNRPSTPRNRLYSHCALALRQLDHRTGGYSKHLFRILVETHDRPYEDIRSQHATVSARLAPSSPDTMPGDQGRALGPERTSLTRALWRRSLPTLRRFPAMKTGQFGFGHPIVSGSVVLRVIHAETQIGTGPRIRRDTTARRTGLSLAKASRTR